MSNQLTSKVIAAVILELMFGVKADAHPHAFVEMKTQVLTEGRSLTGFRMEWLMDETSSAPLIYDIMQANDKTAVINKIIKDIDQNVEEENFFSHAYDQNLKPLPFKERAEAANIELIGLQLLYSFTVNLKNSMPLKQETVLLSTYDRSYFVAMYYNSVKDLDFSSLPKDCQGKLIEPKTDSALSEYAKSLDKTQRDEDLTLGVKFAQQVLIKCR